MTQDHHTPLAVDAALTASALNQVSSDLDSAINGAAAAQVATTKGDLIAYNGSAYLRLVAGANGTYLRANNAAASGLEWGQVDYPIGFVKGFQVQVTGTSVTVQPGACRSDDDTLSIKQTTADGDLTINPAVVGANGIDVGALGANAWYRVFVIYNPGTDTVAGLISTSSSPTMPSGYTVKRRVGWVKTDGSSVLYKQQTQGSGDSRRVRWLADTTASPFLIWNAINVGSSWTSQSMSAVAPSTSQTVIAYHARANAGATLRMRVSSDQVLTLAAVAAGSMIFDLALDTSQAFEYIAEANDEDATLQAQGYVDDLSVSFV